jgi:hypothetical protein
MSFLDFGGSWGGGTDRLHRPPGYTNVNRESRLQARCSIRERFPFGGIVFTVFKNVSHICADSF